MRRAARLARTLFLGALLLGLPWGARAEEARPPAQVDLHVLYQRLRPGMTVEEVAAAAGRRALLASREPVVSWLIWNPPATGQPTTVLRASFRDGRLVRAEYESFGDEYRRLVKGAEPAVEIDEDELRRLWRRDWRLTQAAEQCQEALEAFHQLSLRLQDRLTTPEQAAWVQALRLRRAAEAELESLKR